MVFYANINTKCFFGTSNFFFIVSIVLFSFSILLFFLVGLIHNGSINELIN